MIVDEASSFGMGQWAQGSSNHDGILNKYKAIISIKKCLIKNKE